MVVITAREEDIQRRKHNRARQQTGSPTARWKDQVIKIYEIWDWKRKIKGTERGDGVEWPR